MAVSTTSFVYVMFIAVLVIFNIAGNSLVCLVVLKNKAMKTWINWLLFHLAIANLLVALFFIPPCILSPFIGHPSGLMGDLLCKNITGGALGWISAAASRFLLVAVAFQRYNATVRPLKQITLRRPSWLMPVVWMLAILLNTPTFVVTASGGQVCVENFPNEVTKRAFYYTWAFTTLSLPIIIMGFLYSRIISCLRSRVVVPGSSSVVVSRSRNKVTKLFISLSVIYAICWIPSGVLSLVPRLPGGNATVLSVTRAGALLNSCINPLVYTLQSQQFRRNVASLVACSKNEVVVTQK